MSHAITRCPKCETSFRVTTTQLDSAEGAVRCGSCLHVFDARSNFISAEEEANGNDAIVPSPKLSTSQPAPKDELKAADQLATAKPAIDSPEPSQSAATTTPETKTTLKPQAAEPEQAPAAVQPEPKPEPEESDDFLISDDMQLPDNADDDLTIDFDETETVENPLESKIDLGELAPEFREQSAQEDSTGFGDSKIDDDLDNSEEIDESWAHALLEELDADLADADEDPNEKLRREIDNRFDGRQTGSFDVLQEEFDADFDKYISDTPIEDKPALDQDTGRYRLSDFDDAKLSKHMIQQPPAHKPPGGNPTSSYTLTNAFEPEPLELTYEASATRRWVSSFGWLAGNIALLLLLVFQVGYIKFDSWSRIEPYRQWYALACPMFACTLPAVDDFNKIKISLVVRADPSNSAVLQADAILINSAEFNQPFPPLALRFSDINDQVVAERVFLPSEYLRGELSGSTEIPPNQPVQIRLELADPGQSAVNYRAYIPSFK